MEFNKKQRIYKSIMLVLLTVLITFIVTSVMMYKNLGSKDSTKYVLVPGEKSGIGADINSLRSIIDKYYLGEVDEAKLKESALSGYIAGLGDEYSEYISKDQYESFNTNIIGNYVGIGIYMSVYKDSNEIVIVSPIKGSPAEEVGLLSGDIITKVDGVAYEGQDGLDKAARIIKGETGTKVHLEIKREEKILEFDIERRKIIINPLTAEVIENTNIGYIQITSFDEDMSKDFKEKIEELKSKNITSLIIDLRNNGGGIVQEALTIADYLVPKGKYLMITVNKTEKEVIETSKNDPIINIPIVVLVNQNSASAAEILVGALKDNNIAKVVGTKTYGKGVIQEVLKLKDGSALKITTEEYFTPNRTKINKVGIEPDEVVELTEGVQISYNIDTEKDNQLNKAIEILK